MEEIKLEKKNSRLDDAIKINIHGIVEKLATCSVCYETFKDPYITKCGHTYCKECISEVVNRQHRCPLCHQNLQQADLIKNHEFGELLSNLIAEREKEKQKLIDGLIEKEVKGEN